MNLILPIFSPTSFRLPTLVVGSSTVMMESSHYHYLKRKEVKRFSQRRHESFKNPPIVAQCAHSSSIHLNEETSTTSGEMCKEEENVLKRKTELIPKRKYLKEKEKKNVENFQLKTCVKVSLSHFYVIFFMLGNFIFNFSSTPLCHEFIRRRRRESKTEQKKLKRRKSLKVREKNSVRNFIQLSVNFML